MILVTSAGGKTGLAVTAALEAAGEPVRALRRTPGAVPGATEVVSGNVADLGPHLDGVRAVYLIWPNFTEGEADGVGAAIDACRAAGVERFVYHSVLHPHVRAMPHHWDKADAEEALFESGLAFVSLQPGAYMDNIGGQAPGIAASGRLESPWGLEARQSLVDLADVAEVAVRACRDDAMVGGCFELCGPEALDAGDLAVRLTEAFGVDVDAIDIGSTGWGEAARDGGMTAYACRCGMLMADHYRDHGFCGSDVVLRALLGREPTTFAAWAARLARSHRAA
ncbi:MAG: NAD(P)H-binding protein [Actinomycetota bacterium]|nr:NAD(P)H-binding protein [Actinomycetota bacterium]